MARYVTTEILGSQCIGDSRTVINTNFENLDTKIQTLSTNTLTLSATSTVQFVEPFNSATRRIAAFVRPASINSTHLASDAVITTNLSAQAVTTDKIALSAVTTQTIANSAITAEKMSGGQFGGAPVYGIRAWVNFNGQGVIGADQTIRAQGNVSRVVKLATGDYRVEFATSMPDTSYCVFGSGIEDNGTDSGVTYQTAVSLARVADMLTTSVRVLNANLDGNQNVDGAVITVSVIR
jgi:hypothetical protein